MKAKPKAAFERTENRVPCRSYDALRRPLFGETHAHTKYSADAVTLSTMTTPSEAYQYAKGFPIAITDAQGNPTRCAQLARPLDWAALTDHAEFFGQLRMCTKEGAPGYNSADCQAFRNNPGDVANAWMAGLTNHEPPQSPEMCGTNNEVCHTQSAELWSGVKSAADGAYDRSEACTFSAFIGYEWTSMPGSNNRHRNVIFRNSNVPGLPWSTFDTTNDETILWSRLQQDCLDGGDRCDVLTIPHNGNLSDGALYTLPPGTGADYARERARWEPLSEIHQGKGNSECRTGVGTNDPECGFEQLAQHNLDFIEFGEGAAAASPAAKKAAKTDEKPFAPNAFLRNVLKIGLSKEKEIGVNPFKFGFAGGTDTHSALPGGTDEGNFLGLHGDDTADPEGMLSQVSFNPGALTVAWAEENSRDAIFEALRRRETYATSGTRPTVRFFGGWDLPLDLCDRSDFAQQGYDHGVPMGSDLPSLTSSTAKPRFAVMALKDPGSTPPNPLPSGNCAVYKPGAMLQRIEIVKGWLDAAGQPHEEVVTVAGSETLDPAAGVDPATCAPRGPGKASLCRVWTDDEFDPAQRAFYYARVLENPTCRWSTYTCKQALLDPFQPTACLAELEKYSKVPPASGGPSPYDLFSICCKMAPGPVVAPTEIPIVAQQRAWTSPVWYSPAGAAKAKATSAKPAKMKAGL